MNGLPLSPECRQLVQALERATARLACVDPERAGPLQQALAERARAVDAVARWVAEQREVSRPISRELAERLARDLQAGTDVLVRLALARDAARLDLMRAGQQLRMLRALRKSPSSIPGAIDCQG
jgi:hypothetical protein